MDSLKESVNKAWSILGGVNKPPKPRLSETEKTQIEVNKYVEQLMKKGKNNRFIKRAVLNKFKVQLR
jgi:hypothetical protein